MAVETDEEMPLSAHVEELVKRALVVAAVAGLGMVAVFLVSERAVLHLWYRFLDVEPHVYKPFGKILTQLKFSALAGLALAIPVLVYETFAFMKPGLYEHEQRYFLAVVPVSVLLVSIGLAFSYLLALPVIFDYFLYYSEDVAQAGLGLSETFDVIVLFALSMGIVFQIPLLMFLAVKMNVASREWFQQKRTLVWGGIITVAALISGSLDPTGFAGFVVAATMIVLFELTMALFRFTER